MAMESDGIEEGMEGMSRVAVTSAARMAAELAREFERRAQERRDEGLREAAQDLSREQAMWEQTRAQLSPVMEDRWWDQATPESIAQAYQQARAFDGRDEARPFAERIQDQVRERYGVDVDELRQQAEKDAGEQQSEADKDRAEAARLMADADREEARPEKEQESAPDGPEQAQEAREDAATLYDTAERREALASELKAKGVDPEAIEARVTADAGQAAPANEATHAPGRTPKARKARGQGRGQRSREAQRG